MSSHETPDYTMDPPKVSLGYPKPESGQGPEIYGKSGHILRLQRRGNGQTCYHPGYGTLARVCRAAATKRVTVLYCWWGHTTGWTWDSMQGLCLTQVLLIYFGLPEMLTGAHMMDIRT